MINYDAAVSRVLLAEFPQEGDIKIYHDKAPEVGDAAYPYIVYRTLSLSPVFHADNRMWGYQHAVRITVVSKNESAKDVENRVLTAMETSGYVWQGLNPAVDDKEYGEKYTALDFIQSYDA